MPVLSNIDKVDLNIRLGATHTKLYAAAKKYGGGCTKHFGQGSNDKSKGLGFWYHQRPGWGGVCKALSVYWMFFHALDQDFWGWLYSPEGEIDAQNAERIIDLHGTYKTNKNTKEHWTDDKLSSAKLIPRKNIVKGTRMKLGGTANQATALLAGMDMAETLASKGFEGGSYKQLSFWKPGGAGGHAVAAWVERDVAFFDPNYGEYWFETKDGFRQWYAEFWSITGYGEKYTGDYNYSAYARKAF